MAAKKNKQTAKEEVKQEAQESVIEDNDLLLETQEALEAEKNKFLRLFAEFENYKKRTAKERIELFQNSFSGSYGSLTANSR